MGSSERQDSALDSIRWSMFSSQKSSNFCGTCSRSGSGGSGSSVVSGSTASRPRAQYREKLRIRDPGAVEQAEQVRKCRDAGGLRDGGIFRGEALSREPEGMHHRVRQYVGADRAEMRAVVAE